MRGRIFAVMIAIASVCFASVSAVTAVESATFYDAVELDDNKVAAGINLPADEYSRATVLSLEDQGERDIGGEKERYRMFRVRIDDGAEKGREVSAEITDLVVSSMHLVVDAGDTIVIMKSHQLEGVVKYYITDQYRAGPLLYIVIIFFLVAVTFGGFYGLRSMFGLSLTVATIIWYVVPRIVAGADPFKVCLIAAFFILALSLYLAHGFKRRTTIAFIGTLLTLGISAVMAVTWVSWARLLGTGNEDALFLQGVGLGDVNLRGLLLGGIILGVLGILDDITTAQAAVVEELKHANPALKYDELYRRGLSVGKEHIASLINTLFLAYAGASLPLFLLFSVTGDQPLWLVMNGEPIAEEIIRTVVGSIGLILAVPITTAIAAWHYDERVVKEL